MSKDRPNLLIRNHDGWEIEMFTENLSRITSPIGESFYVPTSLLCDLSYAAEYGVVDFVFDKTKEQLGIKSLSGMALSIDPIACVDVTPALRAAYRQTSNKP